MDFSLMPKAPKTHEIKSFGKSHSQEVKRLNSNKSARYRQNKRKYATYSKQWKAIRQNHIRAVSYTHLTLPTTPYV